MFKKNPIEAKLDEEIATLLEKMGEEDKDSDKYAKMANHLTSLYELRHKSRFSKEQLATIGANLAGIIVILSHERAHVIASKSLTFVRKLF